MRLPIIATLVLGCIACDIRLDTAGTPAVPTSPTGPTITVTNTNTNTSTTDRTGTDTEPTPSGGGGSNATLPLPAYGERVTRDVAAANPALLANSCQEVSGESAWQFLDLVIRELRDQNGDQRWGYLCKDAACMAFARDVVAYKASTTESGIWIVDVIGNHCPGPSDPPPTVRWGVLPFETVRKWATARR